MKNKAIYKFIGKVLIAFSILLLFPIIVSIIYKNNILPFIIPFLISLILGLLLNKIKATNKVIYAKDGFIIVSLSWIIISFISALPFTINGNANYIDSLFEAVSGLTTTGASIMTNVEVLDKNILFWRSFMHFIGGMGVLAFVMAIIPLSKDDKSLHLLKAEMPGPNVSKLVPSVKKTLFYLYSIYLGLTTAELILLMFGGLNFFDAMLISFGTAGTGGFSMLNTSLATYSTFSKWVVGIFMLLFGVNFNIYFLLMIRDFKSIYKSEELRTYIFIFIFALTIVLLNTYQSFATFNEAVLNSFFHVSSLITSTGYSIGDINIYPTSSRVVCLGLMLISACAGSTCGGFKISRLIICIKSIKRDILKVIHPNSVRTIYFENKKVSDDIVKNTCSFLFMYVLIIIIIMFIVSFDELGFETTINAVFCTFANVGLSFNITNFAEFSNLSKIVLSIGMLLGRLEIYPIVVLFSDLRK